MPRNTSIIVKMAFLGTSALLLLSGWSVSQGNAAAKEKIPWEAMLRMEGDPHAAVARSVATDVPVTKKKKRAAVAPRKRSFIAQVIPSRGSEDPLSFPKYLEVVDQKDIREEHKIIADEVLRMLPSSCRSIIKNFYVRYDNPEQRGLAGKSSVILSGNVPEQEFRALLIHEVFGHVVDLGCLRGTPESGASDFRDGMEIIYNNDPSVAFYRISWENERNHKAGVDDRDFVTGYASWDPFEDMAESVTYYVLEQQAFRERAQQNPALAAKLRWIETMLFPKGIAVATGYHVWENIVPWDATKLPYLWNGARAAAKQ